MKLALLTAFTIVAMGMAAAAQTQPDPSVCSRPAVADDNVVLTICNREAGMVPIPQPQLYLKLYSDGRGEYERPTGTSSLLALKKFQISSEELQEIISLGNASDFPKGDASYPAFRQWDDSWMTTTTTFSYKGASTRIVLANFYAYDPDNKKHYPTSLIQFMFKAVQLRERAEGIVRPVPVITFCDLVKNHESYFGQKVSIYADLEYGVNVYLHDPNCGPTATERIGVGYSGAPDEIATLEKKGRELTDVRFGGRARVLVTGILVDESNRAVDTYDYRFDISEFKSIEPIVLPYTGSLELGRTYSDTFDYRKAQGLRLSSPMKFELHHAARIKWTNEKVFPALLTDGRKYITFRVVSREDQPMGSNRWDTTFNCEIVELK